MIRILHVDDNIMDREIIKLQLRRRMKDFKIFEAESVSNAVELLDSITVDCILCDYQMPGDNGLVLLKRLRENHIDIPFIFYTGQGNEELAAEALRSGADDYFTKAESFAHFERLENSIRRVVDSSLRKSLHTYTEIALRQSEEQIHSIFSNASVGIALMDVHGRVLMSNEANSRFLGYSEEEIVGMHYTEFTHPDDVKIDSQLFKELLKGERSSYSIEKRFIRKDGKVIWGRLSISLIGSGERSKKQSVVVCEDIDERKKMEQSLQASESRYRLLAENARELILIHDMKGNVIYLNPAGLQLTGYSEAEVRGLNVTNLFSREYIEQNQEHLTLGEGGDDTVTGFDIDLITKDGRSVSFEVSTSLLKNGEVPTSIIMIGRDVTERKRAEQALMQEKEFKERVLTNLPIGIAVNSTIDGSRLYLNRKFAEIYGHSEEEIQDVNTFFELVYPDPELRKEIMTRIKTDIESGDPERMHWENIRINQGTEKEGYVSAMNIPLPEQNLMISTVWDVTDIVLAKQAVEQSEVRYRNIVETAEEGILTLDANANIIFANPRMAQMLGYSEEEMIGQSLFDFIDEDMIPLAQEKFQAVVSDEIRRFDFKFRRKDGTPLWNIVAVNPQFDEEGNFIQGFGMYTDISERKRIEEELEKQTTFLNHIINTNPNLIFVKDLEGRHVLVNQAMADFYGMKVEDLEGKTDAELPFPAELIPLWKDQDDKVIATGGELVVNEVEYIKNDGERHFFDVLKRPMRDETKEIKWIFGYAIDITEKQQSKQILKDQSKRLEDHARLLLEANNELESFAYTLSHDLRAPLRRILEYCQVLKYNYSKHLDDQGQHVLKRIDDIAVSMTRLIEKLLEFSRVTGRPAEKTEVDLSEVANKVVDQLKTDFPDRDVNYVITENIIAEGDPLLLKVVLENLLGNALKYSANFSRARIEIGETNLDGKNVLFVKDNGIGFEQEHADTIFLPFQRLHTGKEYEGAGIGLATVHRIIKSHGGSIWAESIPGEGSTFYFTLQ